MVVANDRLVHQQSTSEPGPYPPRTCSTRYDGDVSDRLPLLTAADLDEMTPDERAAAFRDRIVTDWDDVPEHVRAKIAAAPPPARADA